MRRAAFAVIAILILAALIVTFRTSPPEAQVLFLRFATNAHGTREAHFKIVPVNGRVISVVRVEQKLFGNWMLETAAPTATGISPDLLIVPLPGFDHPRRVVFGVWHPTWRNYLRETLSSLRSRNSLQPGWSSRSYLTNELPPALAH